MIIMAVVAFGFVFELKRRFSRTVILVVCRKLASVVTHACTLLRHHSEPDNNPFSPYKPSMVEREGHERGSVLSGLVVSVYETEHWEWG